MLSLYRGSKKTSCPSASDKSLIILQKAENIAVPLQLNLFDAFSLLPLKLEGRAQSSRMMEQYKLNA